MIAEARPVRLQSWRTGGCGAHCRRVRGVADGSKSPLWFDLHDPADHEQAGRLDGYGTGYEAGRLAGLAESATAARREGWSAGVAVAVALMSAPHVAWGETQVRTGALVIDLAAGGVTVSGRDVLLSETEWLILSRLAGRLGRLISVTELADVLWPDGVGRRHCRHRAVELPRHTIRVHMARVRTKLGASARLVKTVPGRGYVLLREEPEDRP